NVRVTLVDVGRAGVAETLTEGRHRQKMWRLTADGREWVKDNNAFLASLRARLPDPDLVQEQPASDLVAVAALVAGQGSDEGLPRERVVAEAYRLFPDQFGLKQYPGWPDALAVDRAISEASALRRTARGDVELLAEKVQAVTGL